MVKSYSHKKCKLKMNFSLAHWKELKRMLQIPVNEDMEKQTYGLHTAPVGMQLHSLFGS